MQNKKPKIAVLIDWYLPGTKAGGPVRSIHSMIELLKNDFEFYIITLNTDIGSSEPYKNITADTLINKAEANYYYFSIKNKSRRNLEDLLRQIAPDLIYINSFWSYFFSIAVLRSIKNGSIKTPAVLAPRGMLGNGALSIKPLKKRIYILLAKITGLYKNVLFHATNSEEANNIRTYFPNAKIEIAPNVTILHVLNIHIPKEVNKLSLFYLGRVSPVKNLKFALECLQKTPAHISVQYDIYGNIEDHMYWNECKKLIDNLPVNVSVTYRRELAFNEITSVVSSYHALFLPTLNENYGHSIVESLLCGRPVIISDQTPWKDLEKNKSGYALPLSSHLLFSNVIRELAEMNEMQYTALTEAANNYIRTRVDLEKHAQAYKKLFNDAIQNGPFQF